MYPRCSMGVLRSILRNLVYGFIQRLKVFFSDCSTRIQAKKMYYLLLRTVQKQGITPGKHTYSSKCHVLQT